jgi:hypothetical protein
MDVHAHTRTKGFCACGQIGFIPWSVRVSTAESDCGPTVVCVNIVRVCSRNVSAMYINGHIVPPRIVSSSPSTEVLQAVSVSQ